MKLMTDEELNGARDLRKRIRDIEWRLLPMLRADADNLVPILDGLPHGARIDSAPRRIFKDSIGHRRQNKQIRFGRAGKSGAQSSLRCLLTVSRHTGAPANI